MSLLGQTGEEGFKAIMQALKWSNTVEEIIYSYNTVGEDWSVVLADLLRTNKSLKYIDLRQITGHLGIKNKDFESILNAIKENKVIENVRFDDNQLREVDESLVLKLQEIFKCNKLYTLAAEQDGNLKHLNCVKEAIENDILEESSVFLDMNSVHADFYD